MAEYAYYPKMWQKAFLLEIIRAGSAAPEKSFAFSLPPESVQIQVPQRVNVTKTFGGVFVDDYGVDTAQISISGNTGNSALKEVYLDGRTGGMDGKSEAYYILEEIMQYKRNRVDYEQYELRLYDLSSVPSNTLAAASISPQSINVDGWVVVLKDGHISRSKDRPLYFSYSLDFVGVKPLGSKTFYSGGGAKSGATLVKFVVGESPSLSAQAKANPANFAQKSIDTIKNINPSLKKALSSYKGFIGKVNTFDGKLEAFQNGLRTFYRTLQGFIDTTMGGVNSVYEKVLYPYDLVVDLVQAATEMRQSFENIVPTLQEMKTNIEDKYTSLGDLISSVFTVEQEASNIAMSARSTGLMPSGTIVPAGTPGALQGVDATDTTRTLPVGVLVTYGHFILVASSETRLDALAKKIYGSPDYADMLATYNGIVGDSEIFPGMNLKIPFLSYTQAQRFNEVYSPDGDFYGSDIALDDSNDLQLGEFNDYATTDGEANLAQAVNLRMSEQDGARVRLDLYGIKMGGGGFDAFSAAVMITSIRESLLQDARFRAVTGFSVRSEGDGMQLAFTVETETGGAVGFRTAI